MRIAKFAEVILFLCCCSIGLGSGSESLTTKHMLLDKKPSESHRAYIDTLFGNSAIIGIKYRPPESGELIYFTKQFVEESWQYSFERKCPNYCNGALDVLRGRLSTGLRISGACPPPFVIAIEFRNAESHDIEKIYVNGTGQCYSIGDQSFYLSKRQSLLELMRKITGQLESR